MVMIGLMVVDTTVLVVVVVVLAFVGFCFWSCVGFELEKVVISGEAVGTDDGRFEANVVGFDGVTVLSVK